MRAAIEVSWKLLDSEEKTAFSSLSAFRNGFTLDAAQAVTRVSTKTLSRLVNKSILQFDSQQRRYALHELLVQFGAEMLARNARQRVAIHDLHSEHYTGFMQTRLQFLLGQEEKSTLDELESELANLSSAWTWSSDRKLITQINGLAQGLHHFFHRRAGYKQGVELFQLPLEWLAADLDGDAPITSAWILAYIGDLEARGGNWEAGRQQLLSALEAVRSVELDGEKTSALRAFVFSCLGTFSRVADKARDYLSQSLQLYRSLNDSRQVVNVLVTLGDLLRNIGDLESAEVLLEESLAIQQTAEYVPEKIRTLSVLGLVALRKGDLLQSVPLFQEAVDLARLEKDKVSLAVVLKNQGMGNFYLGNLKQAETIYRQSLEIFSELGQLANIAECQVHLAFTLLHQGLSRQALLMAPQAYSQAKKWGDLPVAATALWIKGAAALAEELLDEAQDSLEESIAAFQTGWQQDWASRRGMSHAYLACVNCHQGELGQAESHLKQSLALSFKNRSYMGLVQFMPSAALFFLKKGRMELSVEIMALANTQPFVRNSAYFERVVGRHINSLTSNMSRSEKTAAIKRGEAGDLWELCASLF
jgi:tetratricopeptide (TPR) repeat protein